MGGHNLKLLHANKKQSWCDPILCHHKRYAKNQRQKKNRDMKIIYQATLFGNMFTRDSRKVLNILK